MNHIKLFEEFLNEGTVNSMEVDFSNAPDVIILKHKDGEIEIDLLVGTTVKEIITVLKDAKKELSTLKPKVKITATDENEDEDRGIGMEWELPNGEIVYGPDFGIANTVEKALSELANFFIAFKKASASLSKEEREDVIYINFD